VATTLVRPDKKMESVDVTSVMKKFNTKSFAAAVDRNQIRLCEEKLGIPLEEFAGIILNAMKKIAPQMGL
jgi:predicted hydrolase (HD superfamily)